MFQLVNFGILPKKFLAFQDSKPLCDSFMVGKAHRKGYRTKGNSGSIIRKDGNNKPGDGTPTDQLVSNQAGLSPQTSGR